MSESPRPSGSDAPPPRRCPATSLAILAGIALAFAVFLLLVIRPFALALFLAAVVAVLVTPLHERLAARCGGRGWVACSARRRG